MEDSRDGIPSTVFFDFLQLSKDRSSLRALRGSLCSLRQPFAGLAYGLFGTFNYFPFIPPFKEVYTSDQADCVSSAYSVFYPVDHRVL